MAYYKLIRNAPEGAAVRGTLYRSEHRYSGSTGLYQEYLTPVAATLENAACLIPALVYKAQVTLSPKFQQLMPLLVDVPGRTGIRIHYGTKPSHSQGCILTTRRAEYIALTKQLLEEQATKAPIYIEICNHQPGPRSENINHS